MHNLRVYYTVLYTDFFHIILVFLHPSCSNHELIPYPKVNQTNGVTHLCMIPSSKVMPNFNNFHQKFKMATKMGQ